MARYGYGNGDYYGGWKPYVPVAERRRRAARKMQALRKKGIDIQPITIEGRKIAHSFWGQAWCEHLESFSDFENRLPRGRTYVRNGSVCHLAVSKGKIEAKVSGSELYSVEIAVKTLPPKTWKAVKTRCSGQIGSLLELLAGQLSDHVMGVVTDRQEGLFPLPDEISMHCSCPDWATMCKHVAAVLYGVGARLDSKPEMLFLLRGVNHDELIQADAEKAVASATARGKSKRLASSALGEVFGIEIATDGALPDAGSFPPADDKRTAGKPASSRGKKPGRRTAKPGVGTSKKAPAQPSAGRAKKSPASRKTRKADREQTR
jgi:uncharacterized Zn finger protein